MGVSTTVTKEYSCDKCHAVIGEGDVYRGDEIVLWSDRDVIATADVGLEITIPYSSQPNVCCRKCAVILLRMFADRIEKEQK